MQPYFFPYTAYWQLVASVDTFVVFDDVNFIRRGYINRNNILLNERSFRITLELMGASQNKFINEISIGNNKSQLLKTIWHAYANKAAYFPEIFPFIEELILRDDLILSTYLAHSISRISEFLQINTNFLFSSDISKPDRINGQEKILKICDSIGASTYVNLPGGRDLYDPRVFFENGISIEFIEPMNLSYSQSGPQFVRDLSIIDPLMFLGQQEFKGLFFKKD